MKTKRCSAWGRRDFLCGLMAAGGTGLLGISSKTIAAGAPPETTTIRWSLILGIPFSVLPL